MSNYSPIVLYGPKDALTTGDPNKQIKGVQLDAELSAIATAISSKTDNPLTNLAVTSTAGTAGVTITANSTSGSSFGERIRGGTTSGDYGLRVENAAGSLQFMVQGDGKLFSGTTDFTPTSGTFSATMANGATGSVTFEWLKIGKLVHLWPQTLVKGQTSTGFNFIIFSTIDSSLRPTASRAYGIPAYLPAWNTYAQATITISNTGTWSFNVTPAGGTIGEFWWDAGMTVVYAPV